MIMNPVIQGGGAEKVYKITNKNSYFLFQETASAGEIVVSKNEYMTGYMGDIISISGVLVPRGDSITGGLPTARAGTKAKVFFIMPADDVTVY